MVVRVTGWPASAAAYDRDVIFESNWSTGTGTARDAVTDGGRWNKYWEFNRGTGVQLLSVVPNGPRGGNALKVLQRGETYAANLQLEGALRRSKGFYLRFYMRNDDTSAAGDHIVTVDTYQYANLTFMRKWSTAGGWRFAVSLYGCGSVYPIAHWSPSLTLTRGAWYRFEYFVDFVDPEQVQVHPRVYDERGTPILGDAEFLQQDWGSATWEGRNDWTLASYYAAGHTFCVKPDALTHFGLGNNGQKDASDTRLAWYFARVQIRSDWWAGP